MAACTEADSSPRPALSDLRIPVNDAFLESDYRIQVRTDLVGTCTIELPGFRHSQNLLDYRLRAKHL